MQPEAYGEKSRETERVTLHQRNWTNIVPVPILLKDRYFVVRSGVSILFSHLTSAIHSVE